MDELVRGCHTVRRSEVTALQRNWSLTLLFMAGVLNLFDRQIVNILAQDIKTELRISDAQLGLLTGTAFGLFYAILGIPLGRLGDRIDRVKLIAASLALWSGFTALCGAAGTFTFLFLARMGVGVGEAGSQPASTAMIPDLFPEERCNSAMSTLLVGAPVGSFLGLLAGGYIASLAGWRTAFVFAGIPGVILAAIMLLTMRDPRLHLSTGSGRSDNNIFQALRMLARRSRFRWVALASGCSTFLIYASGAWLPPFFIRVHAMTAARTGWFSAIAVGLGGGIGTLGSGIACDLLRKRFRNVESKAMLLILGLSIPTLLGILFSAHGSVALIWMFLFNLCAYGWLGPTTRLIQSAAPTASRALAIAMCGTMASIVSLGLGLPFVGAMSDALTPHIGQRAIGYALAFGVSAAALLAMFAHWRSLRANEDFNE